MEKFERILAGKSQQPEANGKKKLQQDTGKMSKLRMEQDEVFRQEELMEELLEEKKERIKEMFGSHLEHNDDEATGESKWQQH